MPSTDPKRTNWPVQRARRSGYYSQPQLTAPTYSFTSTGKMVVESKADMKKRGMRSPDLADAFLLTFACGERRKITHHRRPVRRCSAWAA